MEYISSLCTVVPTQVIPPHNVRIYDRPDLKTYGEYIYSFDDLMELAI